MIDKIKLFKSNKINPSATTKGESFNYKMKYRSICSRVGVLSSFRLILNQCNDEQ